MKRLILMLLLCCSTAYASVADLKLSTAQIFDVQWYVSGGKLYASGFNYIYSSVNYATQTTSAARLTSAQYADINSVAGRYIGFFASTTNPGTYGMAVFNADGTKYKILNNTGSFRALADGAIFYNGNGMWGTLVTTGAGYNMGSSANFTITADYPTGTQLQNYTPPSFTPLTAGQTAAPPAPTYSASISTAQQSRVTAARNRAITNNSIYIDQVGNNNAINITQVGNNNLITGIGQQAAKMQGNSNNITLRQGNPTGNSSGKNLLELSAVGDNNTLNLNQGVNQTGVADPSDSNNHYQMLNLSGSNNSVTTVQKDTVAGAGHFMEATVSGSNNVVDLKQSNAGAKVLFTNVNGSSNTVSVTQKDAGTHYLDVGLVGNGNTATVVQSGNTQNRASISITNAGGPGAVDLQQTGGQVYNITTSCVTAGGCAPIVVRQGQ